jgi:hypothetical protein
MELLPVADAAAAVAAAGAAALVAVMPDSPCARAASKAGSDFFLLFNYRAQASS